MTDLTRWNRAGLSRFDYIDGNAAVFLETLRVGLAARFPDWVQLQAVIPADETEEARKRRLEALYAADPDDMLWHLTRQFARAGHVLGVHMDAYANEGYLGTASQWEYLRRLVALLDYVPRPGASASTPLALLLKAGQQGTVSSGLQVKYSPAKGAPVVFETLADLKADAAFNILYARDHLHNPRPLHGTTLLLEGRLDKLKGGEPLVLENERVPQGDHSGKRYSAHMVQGLLLASDHTVVTVTPAVSTSFLTGWTVVHILPKERLRPLDPATRGVEVVGHALQLAVPAGDLAAGDLVVIRSADDKPYFRRIKAVHDDRLVFYRAIGALTLNGATVGRALTVPLTYPAKVSIYREIQEDGTVLDVVYAAGDWSRLAGEWLAHIRTLKEKTGEREYIPAYRCIKANYVPVDTSRDLLQPGDHPGYTALTLAWHPDRDGVPGKLDFRLRNPQSLLAPPPAAGPWPVDTFLNRSDDGHLVVALVTEQSKKTAAGDLAVVATGDQMAWAYLATVTQDAEHGESTLTAKQYWQDRGGGPFFLSRTRVYGHFEQQVRPVGWQDNSTALSGKRVLLESMPQGLKAQRTLIVDNGSTTLQTTAADVDPAGWLTLADPLPDHTTAGNLAIYGNVVRSGHGESRPERVLGSGDGTASGQHFTLDVTDLSFVADPAMGAGVRAALEVTVAGETWTQVSNLKDSEPADAHYLVQIDEDGKAVIRFGDGRHGRRLPSGGNNVRARYRQGVGTAGNLPAGSLVKLVKPHPLLDAVMQPLVSSGGAGRERSADLRENAPATVLALDRAVSLEDLAQLARGHASVWQARAFRLPPGLGRREQLEVVVMAAGGGEASIGLRADLTDYLQARTQPGVAVTVNNYTPLKFGLTITVRIHSAAYDARSVRAAVIAALEQAFGVEQRQLGQPLYRGDVYKVVEGVTGVDNSDCKIDFSVTPADAPAQVAASEGVIQAVRPGPRQCLLFDGNRLVLNIGEYIL